VRRYDRVILLGVVLVFGIGFLVTAQNTLTTYTTLAGARESGTLVQVKGTAIAGSLRLLDSRTFSFAMADREGQVFRVTHTGAVPANLFDADGVVVSGRYAHGEFLSRRILVRCPTMFHPRPGGVTR